MDLLPEGQRNTAAEVSWEDQQRINKFSTMISKKDEQLDALQKLKTEKEYLDDLSMEIELLDDEEEINYKVGDAFFLVDAETAISKIEHENEELSSKISEGETVIEALDDELDELKKQLYAKFGKNINLER